MKKKWVVFSFSFFFSWFFIDEEKKKRGFGREKGRRIGLLAGGRKKRRKQGVVGKPPSPSRVVAQATPGHGVARRLPRGQGVAAWPLLWLEGGGAATLVAGGGGPTLILFFVLVFCSHLKSMHFS
jgi:hypothetical protein